MRDEHASQILDPDPGVREPAAQRLFGLRGVQAGVDEAPAALALDQVGVHDREAADREGDRDAPDARRDEVAQRARGPRQVTLGTMGGLRPVRLAAQDTALSRQRPPVRIRYGLPVSL